MSVLHVRQIGTRIRDLFEQHLDSNDIGSNDPERDQKILTRCLAAYAVYSITGCTEIEAASSIVDGGDDNGLDAIFYSPNTREMVLVQSKWINDGIGEPDSAAILKFCTGVRDLFDCNFDRFNQKVQRRQAEIENAISKFDTRYHVVVIDTGDRGLAEHSQRHIDDLLSKMNDAGEGTEEPLVTSHRYNQAKIHSSLAKTSGAAIDLEVCLQAWGKVDQPFVAYHGLVSLQEIAVWWADNKRRLFERNIRQVLGATEINAEIRASLESQADHFVYFNNGITIVADTIKKSMIGGGNRDSGTFHLQNAQIVNGAQTVSSIGEYIAGKRSETTDGRVLVRLITLESAPDDFGVRVTRANNRQNRIENRDFASQDPQQIRIKHDLILESIEYCIVRSDSYKPADNTFDIIESTVALACASNRVDLVVQAKREIGKFFEDLNGSIYKSIFNSSVSGTYVWHCVKTVRLIENQIKASIRELPKRSGRRYGLLVHGNRLLAMMVLRDGEVQKSLKMFEFSIDDGKIKKLLASVIDDVEAEINASFSDSMLGTFFKNASKCKELVDAVIRVNNSRKRQPESLFPELKT